MALPSSRALSIVPQHGGDIEWWQMTQQQAAMLVKTGFLPSSIKTAEQAVAIMMKGRELGVPPMYALSNITVIQGKPTCNSELMLALVRRDHGPNVMRIKHSDNDVCTVEWKSWGDVSSYTFSIEDARRAGLLTNQTWQKYPAAMLRARCISAVCRMAFPESIAGMYTPEELGGFVDESELDSVPSARPIQVNTETGEIIDTPADNGLITDRQMRHIQVLRNRLGMTPEQLRAMAGVASAKDMTVAQADEVIAKLEAIEADMDDQDGPDDTDFDTGEHEDWGER